MTRSDIGFTDRNSPYNTIRPNSAASDATARAPWQATRLSLVTAAFVAALALAWPLKVADAQAAACGLRDSVVERLKIGFNETEAGYGVTGSGMVAELFVSDSGSWTIVITRPDGISCLVAAGQSWEMKPEIAKKAAPDPAS
ncbi:MAG: hypothetical protein R8L07_21735 [Alphaproteobacteria bacterium]|nr:hypothetical protein [Alphaproteobacteria bacterium]